MAREHLIARTFVELADTLVEGYDPLEFLHHLAERCVEVLGMAEAGLVLVDARGQLQALASSSERMHLVELLEVQHEDGPCLDCWRSGGAVAEDHLADADLVLAQAIADVATIGILHERFIARRDEVTEQLQVAFHTRVVLEQAEGVVAEAARTEMDNAFALLRGYARHHNLLLSEVARQVIDRELVADALVIQPRTQGSRRR